MPEIVSEIVGLFTSYGGGGGARKVQPLIPVESHRYSGAHSSSSAHLTGASGGRTGRGEGGAASISIRDSSITYYLVVRMIILRFLHGYVMDERFGYEMIISLQLTWRPLFRWCTY